MPILAFLHMGRWVGLGGGGSHSIHEAKEVGPQSTRVLVLGIKEVSSRDARRSVPMMLGDGFASKPGGIMEFVHQYYGSWAFDIVLV